MLRVLFERATSPFLSKISQSESTSKVTRNKCAVIVENLKKSRIIFHLIKNEIKRL